EPVAVDQLLIREEFQILAAEGVRFAAGEMTERHAVAAADARIQFVHGAQEAVGRQPAGDGVGFDESAVKAPRIGGEDPVQSHGARHSALPWPPPERPSVGKKTLFPNGAQAQFAPASPGRLRPAWYRHRAKAVP